MLHDNSPETPEFADDVSRISLTSSEVQRMHKLQDRKRRTPDEDDELNYLQDRWNGPVSWHLWERNMNWTIKPSGFGFYITRKRPDPLSRTGGEVIQYLHSDGRVSHCTKNSDSEWAGYFPTKEAAEKVVSAYKEFS